MRFRVAVATAIAVQVISIGAVSATDVPIAGDRLQAISPPHRSSSRFLFRTRTDLAGELAVPTASGATLALFEAACDGGGPDAVCSVATTSGDIALDAANWRALGNPPGSRGFRYQGASSGGDGVRSVLYRNRGIAVRAGKAWPWQPAGGHDLTVLRLQVGDRQYCSEFGGNAAADQPGHLLLRNAPAPAECRALCGDGIISGAETCDPPDTFSCGADCQIVPTCPEDPPSVLLDCITGPPTGIGVGANGATFGAVWSRPAGIDRHVYLMRLDAGGQSFDAAPVQVSSAAEAPATSAFNAGPKLTPLGDGFTAYWSGSASSDFGFVNYFQRRTVPSAGPITDDVVWINSETPFGQCSSASSTPLHATANLDGTGVHVTWRVHVYCGGPLFDYIHGVPGEFSFPPPGNVSSGGAPLATGDSDVAAVWWNLYAASLDPPYERSLKAAWIAPAPAASTILTLVDAVDRSESPALAVVGDLFFAVWTIATGPFPAVPTQVRGMRFTRADGPLDPPGGILIATAAGTSAHDPLAVSDGTNFVVAWRETTGPDATVRLIRVATDGSLVDATPLDVVQTNASANIALTASPTGTMIGYTRAEPDNLTSIRVLPLP